MSNESSSNTRSRAPIVNSPISNVKDPPSNTRRQKYTVEDPPPKINRTRRIIQYICSQRSIANDSLSNTHDQRPIVHRPISNVKDPSSIVQYLTSKIHRQRSTVKCCVAEDLLANDPSPNIISSQTTHSSRTFIVQDTSSATHGQEHIVNCYYGGP